MTTTRKATSSRAGDPKDPKPNDKNEPSLDDLNDAVQNEEGVSAGQDVDPEVKESQNHEPDIESVREDDPPKPAVDPVVKESQNHQDPKAEPTPPSTGITFAQIAQLQDIIKASVAEETRKAIEKAGIAAPLAESSGDPTTPKFEFKKHYRCDVSPNLKIQALDMTGVEYGARPQDSPLNGEWIEFRLGHYFTNNDNHIAQIEWMMQRQSVDAEGQTIGGNPSIYEDDGTSIFRCPHCDFVTASPNGFKAHLRASHGVTGNA